MEGMSPLRRHACLYYLMWLWFSVVRIGTIGLPYEFSCTEIGEIGGEFEFWRMGLTAEIDWNTENAEYWISQWKYCKKLLKSSPENGWLLLMN